MKHKKKRKCRVLFNYAPWIGCEVTLKSKEKFASGLYIHTVKGLISHPDYPDENVPTFIFHEDNSYIQTKFCTLVKEDKLTKILNQYKPEEIIL